MGRPMRNARALRSRSCATLALLLTRKICSTKVAEGTGGDTGRQSSARGFWSDLSSQRFGFGFWRQNARPSVPLGQTSKSKF
eukprot:scaffold149_cov315-Pinguiococcus_pyrenoidosus.AAC.148